SFRFRHPEISVELLTRVSSLLMPDQADSLTLKKREAGDNSGIITELPVPVDLGEVRTHCLYVIEKVGPPGIARKFDLFVGRKMFHLEWLLAQAHRVGSTNPFNILYKFTV